MNIAKLPLAEIYKFSLTIGLGLILDLSIALLVLQFTGSFQYAAILGFLTGAVFNYFVLGRWVFKRSKDAAILAGILRYAATVIIVLAVRVFGVTVLSEILPDNTWPILILGGGVLLSFVVNYLANKYWVFQGDKLKDRSLHD